MIKDLRKTNTSALLIEAALLFSAEKGFEHVHALCKKELLDRWAKAGFSPIENAQHVEQNGMILIPIAKRLALPQEHITLETDPDILNRTEGEWFENAQIRHEALLDRSRQRQRFVELSSKVRKLRIAPHVNPFRWHPPLKYDPSDIFDSNTK